MFIFTQTGRPLNLRTTHPNVCGSSAPMPPKVTGTPSSHRGMGLFSGKKPPEPQWLHDKVGTDYRIKIPQFGEDLRSLNLATSAGIGAYEALRQLKS